LIFYEYMLNESTVLMYKQYTLIGCFINQLVLEVTVIEWILCSSKVLNCLIWYISNVCIIIDNLWKQQKHDDVLYIIPMGLWFLHHNPVIVHYPLSQSTICASWCRALAMISELWIWAWHPLDAACDNLACVLRLNDNYGVYQAVTHTQIWRLIYHTHDAHYTAR